MNLFFSYTIRDGLVDVNQLRRIAKNLEACATPYIDLLEHRCGGHQPSVWKALNRADALLLCSTPMIFQSPWVRNEYLTAMKRGLPIFMAPLAYWLAPRNFENLQTWLNAKHCEKT